MSEIVPSDTTANLPPFWVEVFSHASKTVVDSCGCYELDEDEMAAAVELILRAYEQNRGSH